MKLIDWQTPFSDLHILGVGVEQDADVHNRLWLSIHCADQKNFHCKFDGMWAFKFTDETVFPPQLLPEEGHVFGRRTFIWEESPWLVEFNSTKGVLTDFYQYRDLKHYIILSESEIVEVLAGEGVSVTEGKRV